MPPIYSSLLPFRQPLLDRVGYGYAVVNGVPLGCQPLQGFYLPLQLPALNQPRSLCVLELYSILRHLCAIKLHNGRFFLVVKTIHLVYAIRVPMVLGVAALHRDILNVLAPNEQAPDTKQANKNHDRPNGAFQILLYYAIHSYLIVM